MTLELRRFHLDSFAELQSFVPDAAFLLQWAGPLFRYPFEREQFAAHLAAAASERPERRCFGIHRAGHEALIGYAEIGAISERNGSARLSRILLGEGARGQGMGKQLVDRLLELAFTELGLRRVELEVYDFNDGARRCYERAGFRLEGIRREADRAVDGYWNSCVMGILEREWRALARA